MQPIQYFLFPDTPSIRKYFWDENIDDWLHNSYLNQIEELSVENFANTVKSEENIRKVVVSFFERPAVYCKRDTRSLSGFFPLSKLKQDLIEKITKIMINCSLSYCQLNINMGKIHAARKQKMNVYNSSVSDLSIAVNEGYIIELQYLIKIQPEKINCENSNGISPLQIAVYNENENIVDLLLKGGADLQKTDNKGRTVLDNAVLRSSTLIVKKILENRGNLKIEQISTLPLLVHACEKRNYTMAKFLLEGGIEIKEQGYNALQESVKYGSRQLIELLLQYNAPLDGGKEKDTLLYIAIRFNKIRIFRYLFELGAKINQENRDGYTPLMRAVQDGYIDITSSAINRFANVNHQGKGGISALHIAAKNGSIVLINRLIKAGANIDLQDDKGFTPVQYAEQQSHKEAIEVFDQIHKQNLIKKNKRYWQEIQNQNKRKRVHPAEAHIS
jgi:ankyrin repeat protein